MHPEIMILGWAAVLLLVHIFTAIHFKTKQYGVDWNTGARDETASLPPLNPIAGRLERARDNYLETLPIAIIALLGVVVAGRTSGTTALGGWIWLGARAVYLPLYWAGVPKVRTLVFLVSIVGLLIALWPLLAG
ncbi:MAPEG family protein [Novosphingobium sp. ZN18A2]|uniref:MAPEG family protein n=1 Tax=Novosphingobium sp. ZN18A2 TaxID=3079861 RepID=UPI0030D46E83